MINNITEGWKTTFLGSVLTASGLAYVFFNPTPDYIILALLIGAGIGLIFAPDKVLDLLLRKSKEL